MLENNNHKTTVSEEETKIALLCHLSKKMSGQTQTQQLLISIAIFKTFLRSNAVLLFTSQFAAKLKPKKIHCLQVSGLLLFDAQLKWLSIDQRRTAAAIFLSCFGLAASKQKNTFRTKFTQVILPVFQ